MAGKKNANETLTPEELEKARRSGAGGRQMRGVKVKVDNAEEIFKRLMTYVARRYKFHLAAVVVCILTAALANVQGTMFMRTLIDSYITPLIGSENPDYSPLLSAILRVACFYAIGVIASYAHQRIMVVVTQGTLRDLRKEMFEHMESLPIRYFDTHSHGDIMSMYTNDIDTLRQMISQSMPQFLNSLITVISVFISMLILSVPLTAVTCAMVAVTLFVTGKVAGQSGASL